MKMMAFWILHQLFHDGLQPLFELAAILGAGDDQRKIERQNALVGQERRHVAVGDALRQAFDDGGFADARLADQHRIVLGAAAEDLDHALQFVIAPDQRIEQVVHGGLGQVAAELAQQRRLSWPLRRRFLLAGARQFFADGREPQAALVQDLGGEALLFAQQAEQQMLGADVLVVQALRFFRAIGQHALALVAQRQIDRGRNLLPNRGVPFDLLADGFDRGMRAQEPVRQRLVFAQQSQQQVLRFDVRRLPNWLAS